METNEDNRACKQGKSMTKNFVFGGGKAVLVVGALMVMLGFLTFGSIFVSAATSVETFQDTAGQFRSFGLRAITGIVMIGAGGFLTQAGLLGLAASVVLSDPQQARKKVEPLSRLSGGVLKDVLDEAGITVSTAPASERDNAEALRKLHALKEEGILTEEEYQREKAEILERN